MINSRQKGSRVEREAAKYLTRLGFPSSRNARNGLSKPDLETPFVRLHLEVKGDQSIGLDTKALTAACDQAARDAVAHDRAMWAVLWKVDRKGWRLTYQANGFAVATPRTYIQPTYFVHATVAGDDDIAAMLQFLEGH